MSAKVERNFFVIFFFLLDIFQESGSDLFDYFTLAHLRDSKHIVTL